MSLEGYSDSQIVEEIERRLCDKDSEITVLTAKLNAAYALIDFVGEYVDLSKFDSDDYDPFAQYKHTREFGWV